MEKKKMERLTMATKDGVEANIAALAKLFPNVVTEVEKDGKVKHVIDFEALKQELSDVVVEGREERYQFTWPDKKKAKIAAMEKTTKTLRPIEAESVGKDGTAGKFDSENLYIEGDNLEVLKLLQETYLGKIKMIYIDPPYNTGKDFVYRDNFHQGAGAYQDASGQKNAAGEQLVQNLETNGRFHTDWLNMIYPRLKLAKNLLRDDGVIFISIDDNEQENLKKVCNEIFGEQNFVAQLIWERAYAPKNDARFISNSHDYVFMFAKDINQFTIGRLPRTEEANSKYGNPDNDPRGLWRPDNLSVKSYTASCDYPITTPSGRVVEPPAGRCWSLSKNAFLERLKDNRIWFGKDGNNVPSLKRFMNELKFDGMAPTSILFYKEVGHSQEGAQEVAKLLDGGFFNGPKPVRLLSRLLRLAHLDKDSLILDFFSGSGTTGHAVMQLNAEDGGKRKFILVQLPEECAADSEASKAGYKNICEIGKERLRRAGAKIAEENATVAPNLDIGFRCLRLDESNMKPVFYSPDALGQDELFDALDNVVEGRTGEDLLFQVLLEMGVPLSSPIEEIRIAKKTVWRVKTLEEAESVFLLACFDKDVTDEVVTEIAKMKPAYAVFRDWGMADDSVATNFEQIFKAYSPDTKRKII